MFLLMTLINQNVILEKQKKIINCIDTSYFKVILNNSLPLIDTTYNSGNSSFSIIGQFSLVIKDIFGFDLRSPITIVEAGSSLFRVKNNVIQDNLTKKDTLKSVENYQDINQNVISKTKESSIIYEKKTEKKESKHEQYLSSGNIEMLNETNYQVNIEKLKEEPLKLKFGKFGPKVLIYHTHTVESYITDLNQLNQPGVKSRNPDPQYNVVRVGEELANILRKKYNIEVIHNGTIHTNPSDLGAYERALNTASSILKSYPSIKIVLDIHRDGLGNGSKYRPVTKIDKKNVAKVMFVIGTDMNGLEHPNWRENLKLAVKMQEKLNMIAPDFAKPIYLSQYRYNQHLTNGAMIIEIGGDGNLLEEAINSTKYLAKIFNEIIKNKG